jgi:hypothetical protein
MAALANVSGSWLAKAYFSQLKAGAGWRLSLAASGYQRLSPAFSLHQNVSVSMYQ